MKDDTAWDDELLRDPHRVADKRSRVQRMFAAIAPKYDLNNRLHSFGMDQRWRKKAVELAELNDAEKDLAIDVACGTGDLTLAFASRFDRLDAMGDTYIGLLEMTMPGRKEHAGYEYSDERSKRLRVIGVDFTFPMLPIACEKSSSQGGSVGYLNADATALPLADAYADVVSIAFGIRNVQEPHLAIAEFYRVLKPGGRVIILEFSQPTNPVIRFFNDLYCKRIMPHTATWISGDRSGAYKYLPMSVETFVTREGMMAMMRDAGFVDVTQHPMTFGVAVVYRGYKR